MISSKYILPLLSVGTVFSAFSSLASTPNLAEQLNEQAYQISQLKAQLAELTLPTHSHNNAVSAKKWHISSYGSLLYKSADVFSNTQDTSPTRKTITDIERVITEFSYQLDQNWQVEIEIEYEHGGTGSSLEYDGFDEFGEFESEIEAGGEIIIEKFELAYQYNPSTSLKLGHIFVPVGVGTTEHKPHEYFTTERYWSEATLIPQVWHETGINLQLQWHDITLQSLVTTGLNSEYFRSYQWVATGHQKRFEQVNANDLALTLRLDYGDLQQGSGIGVSFYTGNTSDNRYNSNKISANGKITLLGLHGIWRHHNWLIKGQYLLGKLSDSQAIAQANKTTPGLKPGIFAQLGSEAEASFVEVAYNSQNIVDLTKPLYFFATYQYANPLKKTSQGLLSQRFNKQEIAFGVNYFATPTLVFKAQYAQQDHQQSNLNNTHSFALSVGYYFTL
jgi:hypothetical protein